MKLTCVRMTSILLVVVGLATARAEETAEQVFIPGQDGVSQPTLVKQVQPTMPENLKRDQLQARVQYQVAIKPDGAVTIAQVLSCGTRKRQEDAFSKLSEEECTPIDEHAREAVSKWRYKPAMKDGKPVTVAIMITVEFVPLGVRYR